MLIKNLVSRRCLFCYFSAFFAVSAIFSSPLSAQAQRRLAAVNLLALYPAGGAVGSEVEVELTSQQMLEGADRLVFSHPGITAQPLMREADRFYPEPRPIANKFVVKIAANVPPGIYDVRAGGKFGLSNPRRFAVDKLPETLEIEDNNTPEKATLVSVPMMLNGIAETSQVDYYWIDAKEGQSLVIEAFSERLDARGDLALALFTEQENLLARSLHVSGHDPVITLNVPSTGKYLLRVYEVSYNNFPNAIPAAYRVKIHEGPWIASIDPPLATKGQAGSFTLYGKNLGSGSKPVKFDGRDLEQLSVKITAPTSGELDPDLPTDPLSASLDWFSYRHSAGGHVSNPVRIALADGPLVAEQEPNNVPTAAQRISWPCEIHGRFNKADDLDWYLFEAKAGDEIWIEIDAQRLDQSADPLLVVEQVIEREGAEPQIRELTSQDDLTAVQPRMMSQVISQDAAWLLKATEDGTYRIMVRDQFGTVGAGLAQSYRLRVRPPQPDFRLLALPGVSENINGLQQTPGPKSCILPSGGADEMLIIALRREGFEGAIEITPAKVPSGLLVAPMTIGAGDKSGTLVVRAAKGAKIEQGLLQLTGRATINGKQQSVPVVAAEQTWNVNNQYGFPARLSNQISVSTDDSLFAVGQIVPTEKKVWRMARGGKLEIPLQFVKARDDFSGSVNVSSIDLPQNNAVRTNTANLTAAKPNGKIELDIQVNATPGPLTFVARGEADVDHRRNLELAEQAEADKKRIDELAKEITAAFQQSQKDRQQADQDFNAAQQKKTQADQLQTQSKQRMDTAIQQEKQATDRVLAAQAQVIAAEKKVTDAKAQVAAAGEDAAKQQAEALLKQLTQQLAQVQAQLKQFTDQQTAAKQTLTKATDEVAAAMKEFTTSEELLVKATETRTKAMEAEKQAQADVQEAQRVQQEANNEQRATAQIANQQKIKVSVHSDPIQVEIVEYPMAITLSPAALKVKAGETVTLSAKGTREFGFDGEVTMQLQGVNGIRFVKEDRIPAKQNAAELTIQTDRTAPVGEHTLTLSMRMTFNGRGLSEQKVEIPLTIEPAPPEEKK